MAKLKLACIVGARPNFMKMAPILRAFEAHPGVETVLVHTGQHYDKNLSDVFFEELDMRRPDISLEVGSGKHGQQTARVIERFEEVLEKAAEDGKPFGRVMVVGDVNSTMATTIAAVKLGVPVAHVEAGLRSFDRTMPEEINRILTDAIADMLLVSDPAGMDNLRCEGTRGRRDGAGGQRDDRHAQKPATQGPGSRHSCSPRPNAGLLWAGYLAPAGQRRYG